MEMQRNSLAILSGQPMGARQHSNDMKNATRRTNPSGPIPPSATSQPFVTNGVSQLTQHHHPKSVDTDSRFMLESSFAQRQYHSSQPTHPHGHSAMNFEREYRSPKIISTSASGQYESNYHNGVRSVKEIPYSSSSNLFSSVSSIGLIDSFAYDAEFDAPTYGDSSFSTNGFDSHSTSTKSKISIKSYGSDISDSSTLSALTTQSSASTTPSAPHHHSHHHHHHSLHLGPGLLDHVFQFRSSPQENQSLPHIPANQHVAQHRQMLGNSFRDYDNEEIIKSKHSGNHGLFSSFHDGPLFEDHQTFFSEYSSASSHATSDHHRNYQHQNQPHHLRGMLSSLF